MFLRRLGLAAPDQMSDSEAGRLEPALEGCDRALGHAPPPRRCVVVEFCVDVLHELVEVRDRLAGDRDRRIVFGVVLGLAIEERLDARDEICYLASLAVAFG